MPTTRPRSRLRAYERTDQYRRRAAPAVPYVTFVVAVALGLVLGVAHNRARAAGRSDAALAPVRTLVLPFQLLAARAETSVTAIGSWLFGGKRMADENLRLRREVARLLLENERLKAGDEENRRLRFALGFRRKSARRVIPAEVVGLRPAPLFDTITVARGGRDGVRAGTPVRTTQGLLGQVSDAAPLSSTVLLLTDASSGVGAIAVRGGKVRGVGIVQGGGRGQPLTMEYLRREDDVRPGDRVVSSGMGGVFPPDVAIGTVVSVAEDAPRFLKTARVRPAASLHHAREVFLLP